MKDELITFETAKLAKEKGFDTPCRNSFLWDKRSAVWKFPINANEMKLGDESNFNRPTQSLLQRWLREIHSIDVWAFPIKDLTFKSGKSYTYLIEPPKLNMLYATYELALESALQEGLKLI